MTIDALAEEAKTMIVRAKKRREHDSPKELLSPEQVVAGIWKLEATPGMRSAVVNTLGNGRDGYPDSHDTLWLASRPEEGEWQKYLPKLDAMVADCGNRSLLQSLADWQNSLSPIVLPQAGLSTREMDSFLNDAEKILREQHSDGLQFFLNAGWVERIVTALLGREVPPGSTPSVALQDGIGQFRQYDTHLGDLVARAIHTPYGFNPLLPRGVPYVSSGLRVNLPQYVPRSDQFYESLVFSPDQEDRLQDVAGEVINGVSYGILPIEFPI